MTLPLPPSINHYYRPGKGGSRYLSKAAHQYRKCVSDTVLINGIPKLGDVRLSMAAVLHMKTAGRADLDNRLKPLQDALEAAGVFDDDSQIDELHVLRGHPVQGGRCHVTLYRRD